MLERGSRRSGYVCERFVDVEQDLIGHPKIIIVGLLS
jgi:hypothetical protein